MALYQKYRPKTLEEIYGNEETVEALSEMLSSTDTPHAFLFHGPKGCGKTTIGRIIANKVGSFENNYYEMDSAHFRGIDTIREIRRQSDYAPTGESISRTWLFDECFCKGTQVYTKAGSKNIEDIKVGNEIYSMYGIAKVINTFTNKVTLDRIIKLTFFNSIIICSKEHLFFTTSGWKRACELTQEDVVYRRVNLENENMSVVFKEIQTKKGITKNVFKKLCIQIKKQRKRIWYYFKETLFNLWEVNRILCFPFERKSTILFPDLCWKMEYEQTGNEGSVKRKRQEGFCKISELDKGKFRYCKEKIFRKNERKQSHVKSLDNKEDATNEREQGNPSYMEWGKRRKWKVHTPAKGIVKNLRMEKRSCYIYWKFINWNLSCFWNPDKLQSRYWEPGTKNRYRNRRKKSQSEKCQIQRLEERKKITGIRLEGSEIYKPGCNDKSFMGVIEDKERSQGYVEFHDLEIEGHPSYYANNVLVHNCHQMTKDAQNNLLKILEDTPTHVYFILCTTEPQDLLATVKDRCTIFEVHPLTNDEMYKLLKRIVLKEHASLEKEVLETVIESSNGQPRSALQILHKVLHVAKNKQMKVAGQIIEDKKEVIHLCRVLMEGGSWKKTANILSELKEAKVPAETIRHTILRYCSNILLKKDNDTAAFIMEQFYEPFYNTGMDGVIYTCYSIIKGE